VRAAGGKPTPYGGGAPKADADGKEGAEEGGAGKPRARVAPHAQSTYISEMKVSE